MPTKYKKLQNNFYCFRAENTNYISGDESTISIVTGVFTLDTTNLDIHSGNKRITINDGSQDRVKIGELTGGTQYGIKVVDESGNEIFAQTIF